MLSTRCHLLVRNILVVNSNKSGISSSAAQWSGSSHYDALGIPQNSTQNEIKTAYYDLSKQYHPDKNKGCETAAKKFREITQAYEVLGNFRLRRLYDKGIIHTAGAHYAQQPDVDDLAPEVNDDPETKFYKSRFKKSTVADASGRTPIYDFDEWSRAHYGKSFQRRQDARSKFDRKEAENKRHHTSIQNEIVIFGMAFCVIGVYCLFMAESSYDQPKERAIREWEERQNK